MRIDDFLKQEMNWTDRDLEYRPTIGYWKVTELLEKYANEQLRLHIVSQQRELLLAYTTALRKNFIGCDVSQINHRDVDWFLKANNCG